MTGTVLEAILAVFTALGEWFSDFVPTLYGLFWTASGSGGAGQLTFLGVLAVAALGISVVFLVNSIAHVDSDVYCESSLIAGKSVYRLSAAKQLC